MQQGFNQKTTSVAQLCQVLEQWAPPALQEDYDNSGLLVGDREQSVTGVLVSLDLTEAVIEEALAKGCNVVVSHHPVIFGKLKRLTGADWVQRCLIKAIKSDIALYAFHTNLDHIQTGVSAKMAELLGLQNCHILQPKPKILLKLTTFVPQAQVEAVLAALFAAGAGELGKYSRASFSVAGTGTFEPKVGAKPFSGTVGKLQQEAEVRMEVLLEHWKKAVVLQALFAAHPYEEVAYDLIALENATYDYGAGILGEFAAPMSEMDFLQLAKKCFGGTVRYSPLTGRSIHKVALCGGSGSFLLPDAVKSGAQVLLTADHKYHQFFEADGRLLLADFGHYETEQFTKDLIANYLSEKFTNFAVLISETNTNPVNYL